MVGLLVRPRSGLKGDRRLHVVSAIQLVCMEHVAPVLLKQRNIADRYEVVLTTESAVSANVGA